MSDHQADDVAPPPTGGRPEDEAVNDTEERYGANESPA